MSIKTQRLLSRANKLLKKGQEKEAHKIYSTILKSLPNNHEAKQGLLILDKKIEINPSKAELDKVMHLFTSGFLKEAQFAIQLLIKNFPNESLLFNISGACYSEIGPVESAIDSFEKAIALNPNYAEAHYNLGVALQKLGQLDDAILSYNKALICQHAYPDAHNNIGVINLELGMIDSAIKSFEWAVAFSPEYAEAHNNLGAAFHKMNKFDAAIEQYKKAIIINPEYAKAFNNLGVACDSLELYDEALRYYEKAKTLSILKN